VFGKFAPEFSLVDYEGYRTRTLRTRQNLWKTVPGFDSRVLIFCFRKLSSYLEFLRVFGSTIPIIIIVILIILANYAVS
jgi:hypothetical protein